VIIVDVQQDILSVISEDSNGITRHAASSSLKITTHQYLANSQVEAVSAHIGTPDVI
jgi:hypothetical protein